MGNRISKGQDLEFETFKNLTSKLLAVPKKELDKQKGALQEKKDGSTK
jgi:hypothetical protein